MSFAVQQSAILQNVALGFEEDPGTRVPVTHRMGALQIDPAVQTSDEEFGPLGIKANTTVILNQEWVSASLSGKPTYPEILIPLSSIISKTEPVQVEVEVDESDDPSPTTDTVDAWDWTFESNMFDVDDPQTFTIQQRGQGGYAQEFGYGLITDFGFNISRTATDLSGTLIGHAFQTGVAPFDPTLMAMLDLVPILPGQVSVYFDDSYENLGESLMEVPYVANWAIGQKYGPDWVLRRDIPGFARHIDLKPVVTLQLTMQRDALGMSPLGRLRNGQLTFIRVEAIGPVIDTYTFTPEVGDPEEREVRHEFVLDFAGIGRTPSEGELGGNKTVQWTFTNILDSANAFGYRARVRCGVSSLTAP